MKVISIAAASAVLALGVVAGGAAATAEPAAPSKAKGMCMRLAD